MRAEVFFMSAVKFMLLLAMAGHILCWYCDRLISYAPGGRFSADALKDNDKMSKMYSGQPLKKPELSMLLGTAAMTMELFGYLAIAEWMRQFSAVYAAILGAAAIAAFIPGVVHHVFCGAVEWFYVRFGCTEEAREAIFEFFKKTSPVMLACAAGLLVMSAALFIAVITDTTSLPRWACVFNTVVVFAALAPLRIVGTLNLAGAVMFLGLFIFI